MKHVPAWMEQWNMWPERGESILCAVSGGKDSMVMLHYLSRLGQSRGVTVIAAHYHHGIRGEDADRDAAFVAEYCRQEGIACHVGYGDVPAAARERGWTLEEAGRDLRYAFLRETARRLGAKRIATAHHARDNGETMLLNLLRGTGLLGLGGIPPVRGDLIRPLLQVLPEELEAYRQEHQIHFVEDASNRDTEIKRNYLRSLWPQLEQINPRAVEHLSRTAELLRRDEAYLQGLAGDHLARLKREGEGVSLPLSVLQQAPPPLRARILQEMLERLGTGKKDLGARHLQTIEQLALSGGRCALPHGVEAYTRAEELVLEKRQPLPEKTPLPWERWTDWGPYRVLLTKEHVHSGSETFTMALACDTIQESLYLDRWQGKDRLFLPGSRGARSVKRLLSDSRIPLGQQREVPVLRMGEELVGCCHLGAGRKFSPEQEQGSAWVLFEKREGERP